MIYYTTKKTERDRMATAMLAFTGYNPSIFHEESAYRKGKWSWRVQDDSIGDDWGSRIKCYLDSGRPAKLATRERVLAHCNRGQHQ